MKHFLFLLLCSLCFISCSDDDDTASRSMSFSEKSVVVLPNIGVGKYHINLDRDSIPTYSAYLPFTDKEKSVGCDASYLNQYNKTESYLRLMSGSESVVYDPVTNAQFDINTGNPLNDEAKGYKIMVYDVSYNKTAGTYYLKSR